MEISIKRVYRFIVIFLNFYTTSNHLHPLQVGNCDSNSRLVVDEDDNGKFRTERVKQPLDELSLFVGMELGLDLLVNAFPRGFTIITNIKGLYVARLQSGENYSYLFKFRPNIYLF